MKGQRIFTAEEMRRINFNKGLSEPYIFTKQNHENAPGFSAREARLWNRFFSYSESDFIDRYTKEEHQKAEGFDAREARKWNSDFLHEHLNNPISERHFKKYESKKDALYTLEEYKSSPGVENDQNNRHKFEGQEEVDMMNLRIRLEDESHKRVKMKI